MKEMKNLEKINLELKFKNIDNNQKFIEQFNEIKKIILKNNHKKKRLERELKEKDN